MPQAGDIITLAGGHYPLHHQLAGSAYGVVWRAGSPSGHEVALKLINREQMARAQPELQARWVASAEKEIAFLASLAPWDERHIVRLLDYGMHEGLPVMALELMQDDLAHHLASRCRSGGALCFGQALAWLGQVNQALAKVHQYGWLYLDLKPANVLIHPRATGVRLADFGTSRLRSELPATFYAGTASWQAPEQFVPTAAGSWDTGTASDYFALGAMFYYLVTGGVQLRFCADCGNAYREHGAAGAATLLARHGGGMPPTLHPDEAVLFAQRVDSMDSGCADATWCPAGGSAAASAALSLLESLLAPARADRPRNAIDISRMLDAIRRAAPLALAPLPVARPANHAWSPA